ncbi:MAG: DNA-directed DNA polymerase II small subunit [Candidatus Asgardarchaeum californiense]|nr:MAG: DNA-directed DNA polymerase II small subunit [Candidatus Asgardarchaeum californiense]
MKTTIIQTFSKHGTFVHPETMEYILSKKNPAEFTSFIVKNLKEYPLVLTVGHVKQLESKEELEEKPRPKDLQEVKEIQAKMLSTIYGQGEIPSGELDEDDFDDPDKEDQINLPEEPLQQDTTLKTIEIKTVKSWKPLAKEYDADISIIKDVTGNSVCEGTTSDFTKLFLDRYGSLRRILRSQRRELANVLPINRIKKNAMSEIQLVGIVKEVRTTTNGHRLIEIEDETDTATCIALKNDRQTLQMANETILDEIIGIRGQLSKNGDLIIIKNIIYPDISIQNEHHKADVPLYAAFLSDIHIGSKQFMQEEWNSFLKWINGQVGNGRQRDVAGKIKYLIIPGDVVDGIGIYPNQEKELSIPDVYRQYEALAEQLRLIPDHIKMIIQPGNHDAVRPAEPQPTFEKEIQNLFLDMNMTFVGNPCYFSIHDVEILSYHGQSLLDYATNIQTLKYNEPVEIMKIMLKKHHLAPTYGGYTPLAPEHIDYMVIDRIPDIFVTGHVHLAQIGEYRGIKLINASSWQSQTSYQKMLNFVPDSAKLPIVDLKTGNVTMMDFSQKI